MAGFKIATGYVEVEVRYDRNKLRKAAESAGRGTGDSFTNGFAKQFRNNLSDKFDWGQITKDLTKRANRSGSDVGRGFNDGFSKRVTKDLNNSIDWKRIEKDTKKKSSRVGEQSGRDLAKSLGEGVKETQKEFDRTMEKFGRESSEKFTKGFSEDLEAGIGKAFQDLRKSAIRKTSRDIAKEVGYFGRLSAIKFTESFEEALAPRIAKAFNSVKESSKEVSQELGRFGRDAADKFSTEFSKRVNERFRQKDFLDWKKLGDNAAAGADDVGKDTADSLSKSVSKRMETNRSELLKFVPSFAKGFADEFNRSLPKEMRTGTKQFERAFRDSYHRGLPTLGREAAKSYVKAINSEIDRSDIRYTNINKIRQLAIESGDVFSKGFLDRVDSRFVAGTKTVFDNVTRSTTPLMKKYGLRASDSFTNSFRTKFSKTLFRDYRKTWDDLDKGSVEQARRLGTRSANGLLFGFEKEFASGLPRRFEKHWGNFEKRQQPRVFYTGRTLATSLSNAFQQEVDKSYVRIGRSTIGRYFGVADKEGRPHARRTGQGIGRSLGDALKGAFLPYVSKRSGIFRGLTMIATLMGAAFGGKLGAIAAMTGAIALLTTGITAAVAVLVQLGSEVMRIGRLGLMLPSLFLSLGAAIGVGILATRGLGSAIFGTGAAYEAAISKIESHTPAAADAIRNLRSSVEGFDIVAQRAFTGQIVTGLNALANDLMPNLRVGIGRVSSALGFAANKMMLFLASNESVSFLRDLLNSVSRQIRNASDVLPNLTAGLFTLAGAGLPFMERFATWMNEVTASFREWTKQIVASGQFNVWVELAIQALKDLAAITWNIIRVLYQVGQAAGEAGLLGKFRDLTSQLANFFESAEGGEQLRRMFESLNRVAASFVPVIKEIWDAVVLLGPAFERVAVAASPSLASIVELFANALAKLEPGVVAMLDQIADAWQRMNDSGGVSRIAEGISKILVGISPLVSIIAEVWAVMSQWIGAALDGLGNLLTPIFALIQGSTALKTILGVVGAAVALYFIAPFGLAHGVVLGVVGVLSMFSGQMDGRVKAAILTVGGLIATFFLPQIVAMGVATVSSLGQSIAIMSMYASSWIASQARMASGLITHTLHLWRIPVGWARAAAASVASSATQVASWVRVRVASAAAGVASLVATNGIVKGMTMAAASAVSAGARMVASLTAITLGSVKAGVAAMAAGVKMAAAWVIGLGPIGLVIAAVVGLVAVFTLLWNKSEGFRNFFIRLWEQLKVAATTAWQQIKEAINIDAIMSQLSGLRTAMVEAWDAVVEAVRPVVEWFSGMWSEHGEKIMSVVKAVGAVFAVVFGAQLLVIFNGVIAAVKMVVGVVVGIITTISEIVQGVIGVLTGLFTVIKGIFTADMATVVEGLKQIWGGLLQILTAPFKGAWEIIKGIWSGVSGFFVGIFSTLGVDLGVVFTSLWEGIKATFNGFISWVVNFGTTIVSTITAPFRAIYNAVVGNSIIPNMVRGVLSWLQQLINFAMVPLTALKNLFMSTFNFIGNMVIVAIFALRTAFSGVMNGIRNTASTVLNVILIGFQMFIAGLRAFWVGGLSRIQSIWNGIINGIRNTATMVLAAILIGFQMFISSLRAFWVGGLSRIQSIWNGIINGIRNTANRVLAAILIGFQMFISSLRAFWIGGLNRIQSIWNGIINGIRNTARSVLNAVLIIFSAFIAAVRAVWVGGINFLRTVFNAAMRGIRSAVNGALNGIRSAFNGGMNFIQGLVNRALNAIQGFFNRILSGRVRDIVNRAINYVRNTFNGGMNAIRKAVNRALNAVRGIFNAVLTGISAFVNRKFIQIRNFINRSLNTIRSTFYRIWNAIRTNVMNIIDSFQRGINRAFNAVKRFIEKILNGVRSKFYDIWNAIRRNVLNIIDSFQKGVNRAFNAVKKFISNFLNTVRRNFYDIWNRIRKNVLNIINNFKDKGIRAINDFKDGFIKAFENTKKGVEHIWNQVKKVASAPVKFMIETVYNEGIRILWSKIADHIDGIDYLKPAPVPAGFASGGVLPGYSPGRDNMVAKGPGGGDVGLSGGEAIMRPEWTRAVGPDAVHQMNKMARQKGVSGLRSAMSGAQDGFSNGGVTSPAKSGKSVTKDVGGSRHVPMGPTSPIRTSSGKLRPGWNTGHKGFAEGGIMGWVKKKVESVKDGASEFLGNLVGWATKPFSKAFDMLKDKKHGGSDKQIFPGVPYHMGQHAWEAIKNLFQSKDDEYNNQFDDDGHGGYGSFTFNGKVSDHPNLRGLKPHVRMIGNFINAMFKPDTMWGLGGPPEHSTGRAIDYMVGTGKGQSRGDAITDYHTKHKDPLALKWVIWRQRIYNTARNSWKKMGDRGNPTQNHFDHPHVFYKTSAPKAKDFISKQKGVKFSGSGGGGGSGGSGNTMFTSFWDSHQPMANGKRMSSNSIASSVIPLGSKLRVKIGGKSATGNLDDLGPASFVYRRHHPKALLDLAEPMMQKLTGRRSNTKMGSFTVTKKGTGRTLFGYTKWNGVYDPSKSTRGFAPGGIIGGEPLGSGSHDVGGMLPDKHVAYNRSGEAEMVTTLEQLKAIVAAAQTGSGNVNIDNLTICIDAKNVKDFNDVVNVMKGLRQAGRANGGNVRFQIRD